MGKLVLLLADGGTHDYPLTKERVTIGRRADNDVCLPHPAVSGEHASVVTILADSFLEDLGSTNGTLVNGKPIVKHFLRDHDQIDIGRQRLVFASDENARIDGLPVDIARNQLLGLDNRVDAVVPPRRPAGPPVFGLRGGGSSAPSLVYPDLDDEVTSEPTPAAIPTRPPTPPHRDAPVASPFVDRRPLATRHESDQRLAAWAAEWAAPAGKADTGTIDTSAPGAAIPAGTPAPIAVTPSVAAERTPPDPVVHVLSGPNLGRSVPFTKDELTVGRVGVQVAVVRKVGVGFRLVPVEGAQPPSINGTPVTPEGGELHPGDTFEVAGVRLELSVPI